MTTWPHGTVAIAGLNFSTQSILSHAAEVEIALQAAVKVNCELAQYFAKKV